VKKGEKILLKPNLLIGDPPEKCVTTHPSVFKAAAEIFKSAGAIMYYGDSPSFGSTLAAAKKAGIADAAQESGIIPADFKTGVEVFYEKGIQNKKFVIAKGVLDSDGIISLPKLKTHGFERYTGCVKNQFGCIPGLLKGEYHVKLPDANNFAKMLVDLNMFVNPRLYIMDGIMAMEGNGPRGGKPKKMDILLMSSDPIAIDSVICKIIDINPEFVPTVKFGAEFGAGVFRDKDIRLLGDPIEKFIQKDFDIVRKPLRGYKQNGVLKFMNNRLVPKPYIEDDICIKCGICINVCPANPKALKWPKEDKSEAPVYNYDNCIRCYCCQELCPESAVRLRDPLIRKIFKSKKN
jgi:uncharacterized protein (DUF362 family)/NAD-dependent dihydropyrimidine dehydrogenase PreA subunit